MDVLVWLFLALVLIPANIYAIKWHRSGNFPLMVSGIFLAIVGVVLGFTVGGILVGPANSGQGGAIAGAFVGLVIVGNGLLYFIIGLAVAIGKLFTRKNSQV
ncbi:inner-membrane translocator [Halobacillus salinarum]|uniref:Inner-membrane translocator n=1 Tax=Halobacillus salinarum TaxID=2932257 RepID=A0ABY4ELJ7_9BACI|nr:inner-membrane translocator [Halobacillus salinarum]UOQ44892.1 inner-membrane translocator [Halobacillus salinarum]